MNELNYKAIGETCGIQIKYASYEKNSWNGIFSSSSEYLNLINLARVRRITTLEQLDLNEHLGKVERDKLQAIDIEIKNYKNVLGEDFGKFLEQSDINFYILGNPNVINFFEKSFSGKNMEKEDWVIELIEKIEKKAEKTRSRKTLIEYSKKQ